MTEKALSKRELLTRALAGSPADCMEAAKKIIGRQIAANPRTLSKIGQDKSLGTWQRIAAIYALGLLGEKEFSKILGNILSDPADDLGVRSHAAEALGNIGDSHMTGMLRDILSRKPPKELRDSCTYALEELAP